MKNNVKSKGETNTYSIFVFIVLFIIVCVWLIVSEDQGL